MAEVAWRGLSFDEQREFFTDKLSLPTGKWTDLWEGQHARAFVVAGAAREDLLADLRAAVDKAITQGTTLREFRRDFDQVVAKTGWTYQGNRGWRTRVIYETNLRTSYQAGRYKQMKALAEARPYWRYRHSDASVRPRPHHKRWDGKILRHDDPWWGAHYPPNGWGCKCYVETLSQRELEALGRTGPDTAPPIAVVERTVGKGSDARQVLVPAGIDPGWGYNVGESAWQPTGVREGSYKRVVSPVQTDAARMQLAELPVDREGPVLGAAPVSATEAQDVLATALGGDAVDITFQAPGFAYGVHVDAARLAKKLRDADSADYTRALFAPWIRRTLEDPAEVWAHEYRNEEGRTALRLHFLRNIEAAGRRRPLLVVAAAQHAGLVAWNVMPRKKRDLKRLRAGLLIYRRP